MTVIRQLHLSLLFRFYSRPIPPSQSYSITLTREGGFILWMDSPTKNNNWETSLNFNEESKKEMLPPARNFLCNSSVMQKYVKTTDAV